MRSKLGRLALAGVAFACLLAQPASADHRSRYKWVPDFMEPGTGHFFFDDEEEEDIIIVPVRRRQSSLYEQDLEDYYEPRVAAQNKAPQKKLTQVPAAKKLVKKVAATPVAQVQPKKQVASGISCDKGVSVVTDYGFSNVEPKACTGKIYTFKAARTGKSYDVSVSSISGEITEVRKIQ